MTHDDPFAGKTAHADWAYYLDTAGTYTPELTATTTDPDLGADGEQVGAWHRNGHLITGWARFLFLGTGVDPGSGIYEISLPFDIDTSIMETSTSGEEGSRLGYGRVRDNSVGGNSAVVALQAPSAGVVRMFLSGTNSSVNESSPVPWSGADRIAVQFIYLADPADLPS